MHSQYLQVLYSMFILCVTGSITKMEMLLSHGADVAAVDGSQDSALHKAARSGKYEQVVLLFKHGEMEN